MTFHWAADKMQAEEKNAKTLLMVETLILLVNKSHFRLHKLPPSLFASLLSAESCRNYLKEDWIRLCLSLHTHFKSEVMGHFRGLLSRPPNCQYTVALITDWPFSSEISSGCSTALKPGCSSSVFFNNLHTQNFVI